MTVLELLQNKKRELEQERERLDREMRAVEAALSALPDAGKSFPHVEEGAFTRGVLHALTVDDAIIKAVDAGHKTPMDILEYLKSDLRLHTTVNSIRTRVSKLGSEGRIGRDEHGWVPRNDVQP